MQRYFAVNDKLELAKSDVYHISKVMRMKQSDKIEIIYNHSIYLCQLKEISVNNVKVDILSKTMINNDVAYGVTIAVSLVSEQKWDYILQKATELGVSEIIPLELSRTLVKLDDKRYDKRYDRWLKICKEAAEQSHRTTIPNILKIMKIKDLITTEYDLKLVCSTGNNVANLKQVLSNYKNYGRIIIIIGPEGGITPSEEQMLVENGFLKASLGNLILRVETAPLFILSAINYELMR